MFAVGKISPQAQRLIDVTHESMMAGIAAVKAGATLGDVGYACQQVAENAGYSVVQEFCGHGIGREFHCEPQVLHYGRKGTGLVLKPGMIFTIEPMISKVNATCAFWTTAGLLLPKTANCPHNGNTKFW